MFKVALVPAGWLIPTMYARWNSILIRDINESRCRNRLHYGTVVR